MKRFGTVGGLHRTRIRRLILGFAYIVARPRIWRLSLEYLPFPLGNINYLAVSGLNCVVRAALRPENICCLAQLFW